MAELDRKMAELASTKAALEHIVSSCSGDHTSVELPTADVREWPVADRSTIGCHLRRCSTRRTGFVRRD